MCDHGGIRRGLFATLVALVIVPVAAWGRPAIRRRGVASAALFAAMLFAGVPATAGGKGPTKHSPIVILNPAPGEVVRDVPLEVKVASWRGMDTSAVWALVNSDQRTRALERVDQDHWRLVLFPAHLRDGKNTIEVVATAEDRQTFQAKVKFTYHLGRAVGSSSSPIDTHTLQPYFPIHTRVPTPQGSSAVALAGQRISPPANSPTIGYQVLVLDGDAVDNDPVNGPKVLKNTAFSGTLAGLESMGQTLTSVDFYQSLGCGASGCLVVIQSLTQMGYTDCPTPTASAVCSTPAKTLPGSVFASLGGTYAASYANGASATAYSLVAQVAVNTPQNNQPATLQLPGFGTSHERLSCLLTSSGCSPGLQESLYGVVVTNGPSSGKANTFMTTGPLGPLPVTVRNVSTTTGLNTMTLGGQSISSQPLAGNAGGFHVVMVDRSSGAMVSNQTFAQATDMPKMAQALATANDNTVVLIASVGNLAQDLSLDYDGVAQQVSALGGSYTVFRTLGWTSRSDDYALIGTTLPSGLTGLGARAIAQASSIITRSTSGNQQVAPTTLSSLLLPDHRTAYGPTQSAPTGGVPFGVQAAALLPAVEWPIASSDPAYQYISSLAVPATPPTQDIRAVYPTMSQGDTGNYNANIPSCPQIALPPGATYTLPHLREVCNQVKLELTYVARALDFVVFAQTILPTASNQTSSIADGIYTKVKEGLSKRNETTTLLLSLFALVANTANDALIDDDTEDLGAAIGVLSEIVSFVSSTVTAYAHPTDPLGVLQTTFASLQTDLTNTFNDAADQAVIMFGLIVTDWGRLSAAYAALQHADLNDTTGPATSLQIGAQIQVYTGLLAADYEIWNFGPISVGAPAVPENACVIDECLAEHIPFHVWFSRIVQQNPDGSFSWDGLALVHLNRNDGVFNSLEEPGTDVTSTIFSPVSQGSGSTPDTLGVFPEFFYLDPTFQLGTDFHAMTMCGRVEC